MRKSRKTILAALEGFQESALADGGLNDGHKGLCKLSFMSGADAAMRILASAYIRGKFEDAAADMEDQLVGYMTAATTRLTQELDRQARA